MHDDSVSDASFADVVPIRPGVDLDPEDDARLLHSRSRPTGERWCSHGPYVLDRESERAFCKKCEREVPLFEVLAHICREVERWVGHRKEAEHRARVARENAADLERIVANAKARLRRLRKHGATVEYDELRDRSVLAVQAVQGRRAVFCADEGTVAEVRAHLPGADVRIDPLMSAGSWRMGAVDE